MDHLHGLSPEEPDTTECHYRSTYAQVHRKGAEGDTKAEFHQNANLVGSRTVANFTTVMETMTVHVFPIYAYCNQRQFMQRYLRKLPDIKLWSFMTRLIQLNTCLPYFLPDRPGQLVASLLDNYIKGN